MKLLRRFLQLPPVDQCLLVKAAVLILAIRLGLWLMSFQRVRRLLTGRTPRFSRHRDAGEGSVGRIAWAVTTAGRYLPGGTCLIQALAAQAMLGQGGHPTSLRIGVAKKAGKSLTAHAWLECQGRIVIGGFEQGLSDLTPLE